MFYIENNDSVLLFYWTWYPRHVITHHFNVDISTDKTETDGSFLCISLNIHLCTLSDTITYYSKNISCKYMRTNRWGEHLGVEQETGQQDRENCRIRKVRVSLSMPWRQITGSRDRAQLILNLVTRRKWVVNLMPRPHYQRKRTPEPIQQEVGSVPEPVGVFWRRDKSVGPIGIWIMDHRILSLVTTNPASPAAT